MKTYTFIFKDARQTSLLYLVLREKGKAEKISLQLKEDPATFDKSSYQFTKANPHYKTLNARLSFIKSKMELLIRESEVTNDTLLEFRAKVIAAINVDAKEKKDKEKKQESLFLPYLYKYAMEESTKHKYNRYKKYTYNLLVEYFGDKQPTFDDINYAFSEEFIEWMDEKGLSPNTRGSHIKFVKAAMNEAFKNKLHTHPRVLQILEAYGGVLPKITPQKFNMYIKEVCKEAGINESVLVRKSGKHIRCEKWELVSSHTARRTGLTNMYKAGIPTYRCMMISGHKTEQVFLTYLRITQEENAQFLKENSFFKL